MLSNFRRKLFSSKVSRKHFFFALEINITVIAVLLCRLSVQMSVGANEKADSCVHEGYPRSPRDFLPVRNIYASHKRNIL